VLYTAEATIAGVAVALSAGAYLSGFVELAIVVAAMAWGARRVRRLLLPSWTGAPAALVDVVLVATGVLLTSELLGTFGLFKEGAMLVALVAVGLAAGIYAGELDSRRRIEPGGAPGAPPASSLAKLLAVVIVTGLTAGWMVPTLGSVAAGMDRADTLWYHMPLAARFVQTGHLCQIFFFDPVFFASFYPANSELFHALGMLFFGRDIASPFLNEGWLILGLLSCYCIGRPYGVGPQALIGGTVALGAQMLVEFQAGEGLNDITGLAFLLAAVAILVNAWAAREPGVSGVGTEGLPQHGREDGKAMHGRGSVLQGRYPAIPAIGLAGLAAGIAAGTKLSFLAPLAALTVGVVLIAGPGRRRMTALAWTAPMLLSGGYWYLRNLISIGNPIPYIHHLGPISLPAPIRDFSLRPGFSVFHYATDTKVWSDWFVPGLHMSLGLLWPVTVAGVVAISIAGVLRGREPILRVLAAVAGFSAIAYVFTPLTASGIQGEPIGFVWNIRYLAPSIAIGFAVLPCLPWARATPRHRAVATASVSVLAAFTIGSLVQWKQGHVKGAVSAALLVLLAAAVLGYARSRGVRWWTVRPLIRAGIVAAASLAVLAGGYEVQRHYMQHRYEDAGSVPDLDEAFGWARGVQASHIALAGIRGIFTQYAFYGPDLSNHVQWLGHETAHKGYARIPDCAEWRQAVNDGHYDYVVTTHDPYDPGTLTDTPEGRWTESDPNAQRVLREGPDQVFAIQGPLDPGGCQGQSPLNKHQLHGVPDPTNPQ
jgi:hypothetical protein